MTVERSGPAAVLGDMPADLELGGEDACSRSAESAGTSCTVGEERLPLTSRVASWVIVPPKWAELTVGCDFCTLQNAPKFALLVILLTAIIFASQTLTPGKVESLLNWLHEDPLRGSISFLALLICAHLIAFPCVLLFLVAGAVFGLGLGAVLVWIGTSIGQVLAFCVGRFMLKAWVSELMNRHFPKWSAIDCAISKEGWKLITLLRLSPIIPWNVLNYALSVTGVPFMSFALPSTLSIIPWCTTTVYFGSLAKDIADVFDGQVPLKGTASYVFYAASGIAMVVAVAYTTIISRRAIREALMSSSNTGGHGQEIVEELDALALLATSPRAADPMERNPMSPSSKWSRALGFADRSHLGPERPSMPYAERPNSPLQDRRAWCLPGRRSGGPGNVVVAGADAVAVI